MGSHSHNGIGGSVRPEQAYWSELWLLVNSPKPLAPCDVRERGTADGYEEDSRWDAINYKVPVKHAPSRIEWLFPCPQLDGGKNLKENEMKSEIWKMKENLCCEMLFTF